MKKLKLKDLIKALDKSHKDYLKKTGKEPVIWNIDMSCSDLEEIELTHATKKAKNGVGTVAVNGTETYDLSYLYES